MAEKIVTIDETNFRPKRATKNVTDVVVGPASVSDNQIVRYDLTTGKLIQASLLKIDDSGRILNNSDERLVIFDGLNNAFLGRLSGSTSVSGSANTAVGYTALDAVTSGASNTAIGVGALGGLTDKTNNTAIGYEALAECLTSGGPAATNVGIGYQAGKFQSGSNNTFIGYQAAGISTGSGGSNVGVGASTLIAVTSGNSTVAVGNNTLQYVTTNSNNTAIGYESLKYNTASNNTALGYQALAGILSSSTGANNTATGYTAGKNLTTAANSVLIGYESGLNIADGGNNVCIGYRAGLTITSGTSNTLIGYTADVSSASLTNCIGIGSGVIVDASNKARIGNDSVTLIEIPTSSNIQTPSGLVGINRGLRLNGSTSGTLTFQPAATTTSHTITMPSAQGAANTFPRNDGSGNLSWTRAEWVVSQKTTTYTAVHLDKILADTSGGAFTINLPASPAVGDTVMIVDGAASFGTNTLTVGRNGSNIRGAAADFTINTNNAWAEFVYNGASRGWEIRT